jgi:hypothetical protein
MDVITLPDHVRKQIAKSMEVITLPDHVRKQIAKSVDIITMPDHIAQKPDHVRRPYARCRCPVAERSVNAVQPCPTAALPMSRCRRQPADAQTPIRSAATLPPPRCRRPVATLPTPSHGSTAVPIMVSIWAHLY